MAYPGRSFHVGTRYNRNLSNKIDEKSEDSLKNESSILSPLKTMKKANRSGFLELKPLKASKILNLSKYSNYQGVFANDLNNASPEKSIIEESNKDASDSSELVRENYQNIEIGNLTRFDNLDGSSKNSDSSR